MTTDDCPWHDMPRDRVINTEYAGRVFPRTAGSLCDANHELNTVLDDMRARWIGPRVKTDMAYIPGPNRDAPPIEILLPSAIDDEPR